MKIRRSPAGLIGLAMLLCATGVAPAQWQPEVRRARPADEPAVQRAVPAEDSIDRTLRSLEQESSQRPASDTERSDQRQLDYANALFTHKLYDLAAPEYQKYLDDYRDIRAGRDAYFSLGECYRNLNRSSNARTNFQKVLNDYTVTASSPDPRRTLWLKWRLLIRITPRRFSSFIDAAAKSKEPTVALSRATSKRVASKRWAWEEAADIYVQVADAGNSNPYRERASNGSIHLRRQRKKN
jgi:tetratricopeptide (TPR) repeat protein